MRNAMQQVGNKRKMSAAGLGGALALILVYGLNAGYDLTVPGEVGAAIGTALTWIVSILIPDHMEA